MREFEEKLEEIKKKFEKNIKPVFDMEKEKNNLKSLEKKTADPNFWNDPRKAGETMKEMEITKKEIEKMEKVEKEIQELAEILSIVESQQDKKDLRQKIIELEKETNELELKTFLSGKYDKNDVILSIRSGAGGVDAQDWAEMLLRMYLRFSEKNNFKAKILDESRGQEAGIKSATMEIQGDWAYGYLKGEAGVHRLVRLSPFNSDNLRETSFALVEVLPVIEEIKEVKIESNELRIDTFRSSGAGGQHVNTTDSAIRITHLPTGIVVTCQNERSQLQNREQAMKILKAKLHQNFLEEKEKEERKLRGEKQNAEWGSQIRSYVLHPYKMVKDHRTKSETSDTESVLEGELEQFIEAYLQYNSKNNN